MLAELVFVCVSRHMQKLRCWQCDGRPQLMPPPLLSRHLRPCQPPWTARQIHCSLTTSRAHRSATSDDKPGISSSIGGSEFRDGGMAYWPHFRGYEEANRRSSRYTAIHVRAGQRSRCRRTRTRCPEVKDWLVGGREAEHQSLWLPSDVSRSP